MQTSVGLFKERVEGQGYNAQMSPLGVYTDICLCVCVCVCVCVCPSVSYLCDHWKSQDEEADAAHQGEERFVFPQVLGELV